MWIRGTWPRFRIDQMLGFAWKVLVPASLANLLWVAIVLKLPVPDGGAVALASGRQLWHRAGSADAAGPGGEAYAAADGAAYVHGTGS